MILFNSINVIFLVIIIIAKDIATPTKPAKILESYGYKIQVIEKNMITGHIISMQNYYIQIISEQFL